MNWFTVTDTTAIQIVRRALQSRTLAVVAFLHSRPRPFCMSNVLVVDDDPDARTLLDMALGAKGHVVFAAENGAEALRIARESRPDIILLDLAMPVMDGFAFRAAQLLDPELAAIPVICVSGRHDSIQVARTLLLADCVEKPFGLDDVIHRVERLASSSPGPAAA